MKTIDDCLKKLENLLRQYNRLAVAASGGMDSTFLAYIAKTVFGDNMLTISVRSAFSIESEIEMFSQFAEKQQIHHAIIDVEILNNRNVVRNTHDRCYHCKKDMFTAIAAYAKRNGYDTVADGSNLSDMDDYRPGTQALHELGVISPLTEAGFTKNDIMQTIRSRGIDIPLMHPNSCLATRVEYGIPLTPDLLNMIWEAELMLSRLGIAPARVRYHNAIARIEVPQAYMQYVINDDEILKYIIAGFKEIGFQYVTIDLEGYRRGSMNIITES